MNVQPVSKLTRKIASKFFARRTAAMIVGKKYSAVLIIQSGNAKNGQTGSNPKGTQELMVSNTSATMSSAET
jgi:hypothetical protein